MAQFCYDDTIIFEVGERIVRSSYEVMQGFEGGGWDSIAAEDQDLFVRDFLVG